MKQTPNRPVVKAKDGIFIRDVGLVQQDGLVPAAVLKGAKATRQIQKPADEQQEEKAKVSRFDCVHQPKD